MNFSNDIQNDIYFYNNTFYNSYIFGYEIPSGSLFKIPNSYVIQDRLKIIIHNENVNDIIRNLFTIVNITDNDLLNYLNDFELEKFDIMDIVYKNYKYPDYLNNKKINENSLSISKLDVYFNHIKNKIEVVKFIDNRDVELNLGEDI